MTKNERAQFIQMQACEVLMYQMLNSYIVVLTENYRKWLPILITTQEATMLASRLNQLNPIYADTYSLLNAMAYLGDIKPVRMVIRNLKNYYYQSAVHVDVKTVLSWFRRFSRKQLSIDVCPSDGIVLALMYDRPIYVHKSVFKVAGFIQAISSEQIMTPQFLQLCLQQAWSNQVPKEIQEQLQEGLQLHSSQVLQSQDRLQMLQQRLDKAVTEEEYEEAAKLRDEITNFEQMRKNLDEQSGHTK